MIIIFSFQLLVFGISAFSVLSMPAPTTLLMTHDCPDRVDRYCEKLALARGVRLHVEDRIVLHGSQAIVFGD